MGDDKIMIKIQIRNGCYRYGSGFDLDPIITVTRRSRFPNGM